MRGQLVSKRKASTIVGVTKKFKVSLTSHSTTGIVSYGHGTFSTILHSAGAYVNFFGQHYFTGSPLVFLDHIFQVLDEGNHQISNTLSATSPDGVCDLCTIDLEPIWYKRIGNGKLLCSGQVDYSKAAVTFSSYRTVLGLNLSDLARVDVTSLNPAPKPGNPFLPPGAQGSPYPPQHVNARSAIDRAAETVAERLTSGTCERCNGSGDESLLGAFPVTCKACNGSGKRSKWDTI